MPDGVTTQYLSPSNTVVELLGNSEDGTVRIAIELVAAIIAQSIPGPNLTTQAELFADLDWDEPTLGAVWGDANAAQNGVYKKSGAAGAGAWTRIGDLPMSAATLAALAVKAPLASPALTGVPTAPTAAPGTSSTQLATTEFTQTALAALVEAAPGTLDTLNELAAALGDDPNFAATMVNSLAQKAPLDGPSFLGVPKSPTAAPGTDTNQIASTSFVQAAISVLSDVVVTKAPLASPALTGVPTAPTAAPGTSTTQLATTAFIQAALAALIETAPGTLDTLNELAAALGDDPNFATTTANVLAQKAPLDGPSFTGVPKSPTAAPGTDTNQIASTSFVQAAVVPLAEKSAEVAEDLGEIGGQLAQARSQRAAGYFPADDDLLAWAPIVDPAGHVPVWLDRLGFLQARLSERNGFARDVVWAPVADASGNIPLRMESDGAVVVDRLSRPSPQIRPRIDGFDLWLDGPNGSLQIEGDITGVTTTFPHGDNLVCSYVTDDLGSGWRDTHLLFSDTADPGIETLRACPRHGQSLSVGARAELLTHTPPEPGRALMFGGGLRPTGLDQDPDDLGVVLPPENIIDLEDAHERLDGPFPYGETGLAQQAAHFLPGLPASTAVLAFTTGIGGQNSSLLVKGTQPWRNLMAALRRARLMAWLRGWSFELTHLDWDQGESNHGASLAAYTAVMEAVQSDITADAAVQLGVANEVVLVTAQVSSKPTDGLGVAQAALRLALSTPQKFACLGPTYHLPYDGDGVHMTAASYVRRDRRRAEILSRLDVGQGVRPLHVAGAVASGTTLVITFDSDFDSQVEIDTTLVSDPGQLGFDIEQDSGPAITLSAPVLTDFLELTFTLSAPLSAGLSPRLGVARGVGLGDDTAGPTTGQRACIRGVSALITSIGGATYTDHNWVAIDQIDITTT